MFIDKTDYTHIHIDECDCENLISSRLAVCRHYTYVSHLLCLIRAVVVERTIQKHV
jgi:hypothetical protein